MIPSYALWNLEGDTVAGQIEKAVAMGFGCVSFRQTPQRMQQPGEAGQVIELFEQHDLTATCHNDAGFVPYPDDFIPFPDDLDQIVEWQQRTGRLRIATFHPSTMMEGNRRVLLPGPTAEKLLTACERLRPLNVSVGVEVGLSCYEHLDEVARLTKGRAGLLLDVGHLNCHWRAGELVGETPAEAVRRAPMNFLELHVHDNDGQEDQHRPLGRGTVPFDQILRALLERGFGGPATLEHPGKADDPNALEEALNSKRIIEQAVHRAPS